MLSAKTPANVVKLIGQGNLYFSYRRIIKRGGVFMDNDWNGFADLITNLITKYAGVLDLDNLPNPVPVNKHIKNNSMENSFDIAKIQVEKNQKRCYNNLDIYIQTK